MSHMSHMSDMTIVTRLILQEPVERNHFRVIIFYLMIFPACHIYDKYMSKRIKRGKLKTRQKTQRKLFKIHIGN